MVFISPASEGVLPQASLPTYPLTMADPTTHLAGGWSWSRCTGTAIGLLLVRDCALNGTTDGRR